MALWLVRAGKKGEHEAKFLSDKRIYLTWRGLSHDLSQIQKDALLPLLKKVYSDMKETTLTVGGGQIWAFVERMQKDDWVALPSKKNPVIHFGKIKGDYQNDSKGIDPYYHYRNVDWFALDIPRSNFPQEILYSLGSLLTICQIKKNDAEKRVRAMSENDWTEKITPISIDEGEGEQPPSLEEQTRDQIAAFIVSKYKGHKMAELVDALLQARGYFTRLSPPGPDGGVDILAGRGELGLAEPHLCVQVKSGDKQLEKEVMSQLLGVMSDVGAKHGLLVSWSGFKRTIEQERAKKFFKVRLWDQNDIIDQLFENYEALDAETKAQIPLKRLWTLAPQDDD
ncbi:MAG: restriction endonuclease [Alphaproteobacteria bacterium GM202ARS2]|nr:restriction endonuclease [Alphaproteobacteria bacterium GM202ARS2]